MQSKTYILFCIFISLSCNENAALSSQSKNKVKKLPVYAASDINPYKNINEIPLPVGFTRLKESNGSFAQWLLNLPLKPNKTVYTFDGVAKANQTAQFAVLDISVGKKDLQQCADAVMRLRAEYLFAIKKFEAIHFTDNEGKGYQFNAPFTSGHLQQYLQGVFGMCGTASLAKQLKRISMTDIQPGDVLIRGGFPGHAVIVMDVAMNPSGEKIYLLAQSYMPAQDIHLLVNPSDKKLSPWYLVNAAELIQTPEYTFKNDELKRW
jgi:hypothetical protein